MAKVTLTEDDFDKKYTLDENIMCTSGMTDDYGKLDNAGEDMEMVREILKTRPNNVWTVVTGENEEGQETWWLVAGFRVVNREGFWITNEEWESKEEEFYLFTSLD